MKNITKISHAEDVSLNRDFAVRCVQTQRLLRAEGLDALLVVCGEDGDNNLASNCYVNWLFKGTTHTEIAADFHVDPAFAESVFVITQSEVRGWGTQELMTKFSGHFLAIPRKRLRTAPEMGKDADRNEFELEKAAAFLEMTVDMAKIGVILDSKSKKDAKVKDVEKWPLVQTFALEGELIRRWRRVFHPQKIRG